VTKKKELGLELAFNNETETIEVAKGVKQKYDPYAQVKIAADEALAAPKPLVATFATHGMAVSFRYRFYKMRLVHRKEMTEIYAHDPSMHASSYYDDLRLVVDGNRVIFYNDPAPTFSFLEEVEEADDA
jgi:hypothetical protein